MPLVIVSTHPIQYHAPIYRTLAAKFGIPVHVIYGSDFSVAGYRDREFAEAFAWDTDLLSGYSYSFLSRISEGGARSVEKVSARGLGDKLDRLAPAAMLIPGYGSAFYMAAIYKAWKIKCPIIFRGETTDCAKRRGAFKALARDRILRFLYKRCAKLLYVGRNSYEHFRRLGCLDENLIFSPYCVDTSRFDPDRTVHSKVRLETRQGLGIPEDRTALIFSGKLIQVKGPDLLLKAIGAIPAEIQRRIAVIFLGSGELKSSLEKMAKQLQSVKVVFAGFQNQSALGDYYHAADLLVLPSRSETWGLVVNEALHHGLACIVSKAVGCAPDLIEEGVSGEIFSPGSVSSLAEAIIRGLRLTIDPKTPEECQKKAARYTVDNAAAGIAAAYNSIVGK